MSFGCQSSIIDASADIHVDIQAGISICKDIWQWVSVEGISMNWYPCFMDICLQISKLLWISIWIFKYFYGYLFGYPNIFMDTHAWTCYGFSIQGGCKF